jgi:hypothetical protein
MAKYLVSVEEVLRHTVEVEASSIEEAKEDGYNIIMNGPEDKYDTESYGTSDVSIEELTPK